MTIVCNVQVCITGILITLIPIFQNKRELPYKIWLPFEIDDIFWILFMCEGLALTYTACFLLAFDCLFIGFMLINCFQFDVLVIRFTEFVDEIKALKINKVAKEEIIAKENMFFRKFVPDHQFIYG